MAWNFAALNRSAKGKEFPRSPDELLGVKKKQIEMTSDQSFAMLENFMKAQKAAEEKNK